ncbi:hypothetical protein QT971_31985 [Microcoleus sp. herbarium19]
MTRTSRKKANTVSENSCDSTVGRSPKIDAAGNTDCSQTFEN